MKIAGTPEAKVNKSFGITENGLSHSWSYCCYCIKSEASMCQALLWLINWSGHEWENAGAFSEHGFKAVDRCGGGQLMQTLLRKRLQIANGIFVNLYSIFRVWQIWVWFGYRLCALAGMCLALSAEQASLMAGVTPTSEAHSISYKQLLTHGLSGIYHCTLWQLSVPTHDASLCSDLSTCWLFNWIR